MLSARLATTADLGAIHAITAAAYDQYVATLGRKPLPMTEDYEPRIAAGEVWIVALDGRDVALCVLEDAADHVLIFSLAVLPNAQGHGIGRWMLDFAEDRARSLGLPEVRLYTNALMHRNIEVYAKAGFTETGRRPNPYRPGWIFVDMAKPVA